MVAIWPRRVTVEPRGRYLLVAVDDLLDVAGDTAPRSRSWVVA